MIDLTGRYHPRRATFGHNMSTSEIKENAEIVLVESHVVLPHKMISEIRKKTLSIEEIDGWHSRKYDKAGTAFYHGEKPPRIRQEPVMLDELNGDVDGIRVILRKLLNFNKQHADKFDQFEKYLTDHATTKDHRGVEASFLNDKKGEWTMLRKMYTFIEKANETTLQ